MSWHTPGPWRVHQHDQINGELWLSIGYLTHEGASNPDGRWIGPVAELKYLVAREDEQRANANLIAAAPDLLAACRLMDAYGNRPTSEADAESAQEAFGAVRDAIAKAEATS